MFVEFILHILYEITLFVLFCILAYKIINASILPAVYGYIKDIQQKRRDLKNKYDLKSAAINKMEGDIKNQGKNFEILEEKLKTWHDALHRDQEIETIAKNERVQEITSKAKFQKKQLHMEKLQKEVMPKAIDLAREEFIEYSKKDGRELLTNLIIELEKKIS